jgi:hypothetical protein
MDDRKVVVAKLNMVNANCNAMQPFVFEPVKQVDVIAAVWVRIETLAAQEQLNKLSNAVKAKHKAIFNPTSHINELPTDVYCYIQLKDASKTITTGTYSSLHKYKDVWANNTWMLATSILLILHMHPLPFWMPSLYQGWMTFSLIVPKAVSGPRWT